MIGNRDDQTVDFVLHDGDFATSSLERWAYAHRAETVRVLRSRSTGSAPNDRVLIW